MPQAKLTQMVKEMTTNSVMSILVGRIKEILRACRMPGLSNSDLA